MFRLCYRPLCLYAAHWLADPDTVEDIVQDAFGALWEKINAGGVQSPKSYLYAIVRNACISRLRLRSLSGGDIRLDDLPDETDDAEAVERSFREAALWRAIDALPKRRRQMLLLEKRDGMSCAQIAAARGVSEGTVRNQISRALKTLRKKNFPECVSHFRVFTSYRRERTERT